MDKGSKNDVGVAAEGINRQDTDGAINPAESPITEKEISIAVCS